jgi:hypothetical protein
MKKLLFSAFFSITTNVSYAQKYTVIYAQTVTVAKPDASGNWNSSVYQNVNYRMVLAPFSLIIYKTASL